MAKASRKYLKRVRIFIGSPSDLDAERKKFPEIVEHINKIKAKSKDILLEPVGWEDTLPGIGRPQEKINEDLKGSDLAVMLLWKRWGTPTGKYTAGFEEEYEVARANRKEVWLYFRSISDDMMADPGEQLKKVLDFRSKVEAEKKFLFRRYEDESDWEKELTDDLCRWLDGLHPSPFEPEKLVEYEGRIEQLERELIKSQSKQFEAAQTLAKDAREHADSGQITKAEEHFAKALTTCAMPRIILDYGLFLTRIGELRKAEEKFRQLMQIGEAAKNKSISSAALAGLGRIYSIRGDSKIAEEMLRKALSLDKQVGYKEGVANGYGNLGIMCQKRGDLKTAEEMHKKALALDEELGNKEGMANDYCNLGSIYTTRGDLKTAEQMQKKALALDEELGHKEGMANDYGNLAIVYKERGDLETAEEMSRKALVLYEGLGHKEGTANSYCNLGNVCQNRGDLKTAEEMFRKALVLHEELGHKEGMANDYGNLGNVYTIRGDHKTAEKMHKKALALDEELGNKEGMANDYGNLGIMYKERGDLETAEEMFRKALVLHEELGSKQGMANDYGNLGIMCQKRGRLEDAETMYKKSLAIFTSIGNKAMATRTKELLNKLGDLKRRK